jgi:hypothetical protein
MSNIEAFNNHGQWGDAAIKQALHLAWEGLAQYYRVMSQSVYYVCLFLNPQIKTSYIESHSEADWIPEGEERLQEAWHRYKDLAVEPQIPSVPSAATTRRPLPPNPFRSAMEMVSDPEVPVPDELQLYRQMPFMSTTV